MVLPERADQVWSLNFVMESLDKGGGIEESHDGRRFHRDISDDRTAAQAD